MRSNRDVIPGRVSLDWLSTLPGHDMPPSDTDAARDDALPDDEISQAVNEAMRAMPRLIVVALRAGNPGEK
jgi:hypothetical protein